MARNGHRPCPQKIILKSDGYNSPMLYRWLLSCVTLCRSNYYKPPGITCSWTICKEKRFLWHTALQTIQETWRQHLLLVRASETSTHSGGGRRSGITRQEKKQECSLAAMGSMTPGTTQPITDGGTLGSTSATPAPGFPQQFRAAGILSSTEVNFIRLMGKHHILHKWNRPL
ncbi:uncharacterized protein LOC116271449 isoform X2 [Papio anubis]|uniref:uncharacterized protein LOC116271449 isoform X2 n=1 Tax=Papio anubis TaxID=9555 RepID=UPI0012AE6BA6|nr:uncharacterized protein LOC116271449 isoform X2 [Papio anubis]